MLLHKPSGSSFRSAMSFLISVVIASSAPQESKPTEQRKLLREQRLLEEAKVIAERSKQKTLREQRLLEEAKAIVEREKQKTIRMQLQLDQTLRETQASPPDRVTDSPPVPISEVKPSPTSVPIRQQSAQSASRQDVPIIPAVLVATEPAKVIPVANHYPPAKSPEVRVGEKCVQGSLLALLASGLTTLAVCAVDAFITLGVGCAATMAWAEAQLVTTAIGGCLVGELNSPASAATLGVPRPPVPSSH